jgi:hypothetical protein
MRLVLNLVLLYVLALLLVGTSPLGTGQGAHQNQLLDALIPHVHFLDGQRIEPGARLPVQLAEERPGSPAVGAGAGAAAASLGLSLTPPVPSIEMFLPPPSELYELTGIEAAAPTGRTEAPPDPPPTPRS